MSRQQFIFEIVFSILVSIIAVIGGPIGKWFLTMIFAFMAVLILINTVLVSMISIEDMKRIEEQSGFDRSTSYQVLILNLIVVTVLAICGYFTLVLLAIVPPARRVMHLILTK